MIYVIGNKDIVPKSFLGTTIGYTPVPDEIDNVVIVINDINVYRTSFKLYKIRNDKYLLFYYSDESYKIKFKKIFIVLLNNIPSKSIKELTTHYEFEYDEIINHNEVFDWDIVSALIHENCYKESWYMKLWNAIPEFPSLI